MPRGSLGDLREHILNQLRPAEFGKQLPDRYAWLTADQVREWLGVTGNSLQAFDTLLKKHPTSFDGMCSS